MELEPLQRLPIEIEHRAARGIAERDQRWLARFCRLGLEPRKPGRRCAKSVTRLGEAELAAQCGDPDARCPRVTFLQLAQDSPQTSQVTGHSRALSRACAGYQP